MLKNIENSYGSIAKILHWVIGLFIIGLIAVGFIMSSMDPAPEKFELYGMHKAFGVIVLCLVAIRILWRIINATVQAAEVVPPILQLAAKAVYFHVSNANKRCFNVSFQRLSYFCI